MSAGNEQALGTPDGQALTTSGGEGEAKVFSGERGVLILKRD